MHGTGAGEHICISFYASVGPCDTYTHRFSTTTLGTFLPTPVRLCAYIRLPDHQRRPITAARAAPKASCRPTGAWTSPKWTPIYGSTSCKAVARAQGKRQPASDRAARPPAPFLASRGHAPFGSTRRLGACGASTAAKSISNRPTQGSASPAATKRSKPAFAQSISAAAAKPGSVSARPPRSRPACVRSRVRARAHARPQKSKSAWKAVWSARWAFSTRSGRDMEANVIVR